MIRIYLVSREIQFCGEMFSYIHLGVKNTGRAKLQLSEAIHVNLD